MTLNKHWGYKKDDHEWKPTETLVRHLVDIVSKGGNFLLNVGPTGEGLIPAPSVERLREVGDWMKTNGEAIHGTQRSPLPAPPAWGRATVKKGGHTTTVYLHVFDWPADGRLVVPGLKGEVGRAYLLKTGAATKLTTAAGPDGLTIDVPKEAPDVYSSSVVVELKS